MKLSAQEIKVAAMHSVVELPAADLEDRVAVLREAIKLVTNYVFRDGGLDDPSSNEGSNSES
jgi:hypothetical protein